MLNSVTVAAGGVGTVSITLLANLASKLPPPPAARQIGIPEKLGASTIIDRNEFNVPVKALAKMRWAGA